MMTRTGRRFSILFAAIAALAKTGSAAPRHAFLRSARVLAAVACLALFGALALPGAAQAQEADVLVSTIGLTPSGISVSFSTYEYAKGVRTGSNTGGYSLTSVELDVDTVPNSTTDLVVQIWSSTGDNAPDSAVITLDIPTTLSEGLNTFPAPEDSVLNASTIYFLLVSYTGDSLHLGMPRNSTGALDDTGLAGWDWENGYFRARGSTDAWELSSSGQRMRMRFNGTAVGDTPTPSTDATLSGLSLGTGVTLDPIFVSGTTSYTADVANAVDEVTVTPTTTDTSATIAYLNASDTTLDDADDVPANGHQVALAVGDTVFKVKVTAEDTTTTDDLPPIGVPQIMRH